MKKILKLFIVLSILNNTVYAQSEFDMLNVYENSIFKPDSTSSKYRIKSITEYESTSNSKNKMHSYKKYRSGSLVEYQCYFLNYPSIFQAKILRESPNKFIVKYLVKRLNYKTDSTFFNQQFSSFISQAHYQATKDLAFTIIYKKVDSVFNISYFLNGFKFGESEPLNDYDSPYFKNLLTQNPVENSFSEYDTLMKADTNFVDGKKCFSMRYITIYDKPVKEEYTYYIDDTISGRSCILRKYDSLKRLIFYGEYGDYYGKILVLAHSEKTNYDADGGYTIYKDNFFADGKADIIEHYNKNKLMSSYKHYFSEGGINELKFDYSKSGLLLKSSQYLDGKYVSKTEYVYTFYK